MNCLIDFVVAAAAALDSYWQLAVLLDQVDEALAEYGRKLLDKFVECQTRNSCRVEFFH